MHLSFLCPFWHLFCRSRIFCLSRPKRRDTLSGQFSIDSELSASDEERKHGERARGLKLSYTDLRWHRYYACFMLADGCRRVHGACARLAKLASSNSKRGRALRSIDLHSKLKRCGTCAWWICASANAWEQGVRGSRTVIGRCLSENFDRSTATATVGRGCPPIVSFHICRPTATQGANR
jgi:hypothetical protein